MATLKLLLVAAAVGYLAIAALVWFSQERLLFHPQPLSGPPLAPAGWTVEAVELPARDGTHLAGVLIKPPRPRPPVIAYYGGNAEEATAHAADAEETYGQRAVLLLNYRGYGASQGEPGERTMVSDALQAYDWLAARPDLDASRIAVHGRSLGSGVAVQVAASRAVRCVVLTSPFSSARSLAQSFYPWLPVGLLLRHPFDSAARAPLLRVPVLILAGDEDNVIPPRESERLASLWGGPVTRASHHGFGHNDISLDPRYPAEIRAFLERCD